MIRTFQMFALSLLVLVAPAWADVVATDLKVYQGQLTSTLLPATGLEISGRGLRAHIRTATPTATVVQILTHDGPTNARVAFEGSTGVRVTIGGSVSAAWVVGADRVEWVYDVESYDLSDADDVIVTHRGKVIVFGNRTRESDVTPSAQMPSGDGRYVRFDGAQTLTTDQKTQARDNIGAGTGGGLADGDKGDITVSSSGSVWNIDAGVVGTTELGGDITAAGEALLDDASAAAQRTTLGLGTAAVESAASFAATSHNHNASEITAGTLVHERGGLEADVSAYSGLVKITGGATSAVTVTAAGEAVLDDADASAQRTTLGLAIGTNVQAYDADLTTWAGVTPGAGVATALATPSSANVAAAVTDETGTGALVFGTSPTLTTPALGTPSALTLTNATGLPLGGIVPGSDDTALVSNGSTWQAKALADCDDSGGNHLNYDTATNSFSCGTSGSGGLSEPLSTIRHTTQSSAASAASSGEVKAQFRTMARATILDLVADVGDPMLVLPSISDPLVSGWWATANGTDNKAVSGLSVGGSTSSIATTIPARNYATAASANATAGEFTGAVYRDGSALGDGFVAWGIASTPDASYGSGATGAVIQIGMIASGWATSGSRLGGRGAILEYNTNQSDTNWQLVVNDGSNTVVDTGLAFAAEGVWFWMIHVPRGGSTTYAYIKNLANGNSGSASTAHVPGSTALYLFPAWICTLTTTARNIRWGSAFIKHGGAL